MPQTSHLDQLRRALESGLIDQASFDADFAGVHAQVSGDGAIAQGKDSLAVGAGGVAIGNDHSGDINTGRQLVAEEGAKILYVEQGATLVFSEAPMAMSAIDRESALGRYLQHLICQNRYLHLQDIRSAGNLVNIELDRIFINLRASMKRGLAPRDTVSISINQALAECTRLVVLGPLGSGKTTLLRYITLLHARDLAEDTRTVKLQLGIDVTGTLPILLPMRRIGRYLTEHHPSDDGIEGHVVLLHYLIHQLKNERIDLHNEFFDEWLYGGRALVLLDGIDEIVDPSLRRRVACLIESFTRAYPDCRYLVTSQTYGNTNSKQLAEGYVTVALCNFTMDDVRSFISKWNRLVVIGKMGPGERAEAIADRQSEQMLHLIKGNDSVQDLAITPLMLTVFALSNYDNDIPQGSWKKLYQLHHEAVNLLLGKWYDTLGEIHKLLGESQAYKIQDFQQVLGYIALDMHERWTKRIREETLQLMLTQQFAKTLNSPLEVDAVVQVILNSIKEGNGLLTKYPKGSFGFLYEGFQRYLAAIALADRDDYVEFTLKHVSDEWWQDVIIFEALCLSSQNINGELKAGDLIRKIANGKPTPVPIGIQALIKYGFMPGDDYDNFDEGTLSYVRAQVRNWREPAPFQNFLLSIECFKAVMYSRIVLDVAGDIEAELKERLRRELAITPLQGLFAGIRTRILRGMSIESLAKRRIEAAEILGQLIYNNFWLMPYGEPNWISIPAGEFLFTKTSITSRVHTPQFAISPVLITNMQYKIFVQHTGHATPYYWEGQRVPQGKELHPVKVTWKDAQEYCLWLGSVTGKTIAIPSYEEWQKAARGSTDARKYPWGDDFDPARCNVGEYGFGGTTPVGIFLNGASPYGCLDMIGNTREWTRTIYESDDGGIAHRVTCGSRDWYEGVKSSRYEDEVGDNGFHVVLLNE
jgi:formylglycine-generating enzyme required for sulfatase activity